MHSDWYAGADALGDGAESFKLSQRPVKVRQLGGRDSEMQAGHDLQHPQSAIGIAPDFAAYYAAQRFGGLLEFAQRKQQRIAEAIAHCRTQ